MHTQRYYVVVRSDGEVRVAKRPRVAGDEVAIALDLRFPDGWGRTIQPIAIDMPEVPTVLGTEVMAVDEEGKD